MSQVGEHEFKKVSKRKKIILGVLVIILLGGAGLSVYFRVPTFLYTQTGGLSSSTTDTGNYREKALDFYEKKKFEVAVIELERAVLKNPDDFEAQYLLGQSYEALGKINSAIEAYKKAVELRPENAQVYYNLAIVYKATGANSLAIKMLEKAVKNDEDFVGARFMLAKMYLEEKQPYKAKRELERIVEINPYGFDMAEVHLELGLVYLKNNDKEKAVAEWEKALEINPDYGLAKDLLEKYNVLIDEETVN
ncbi:tetratricopeptide repeat protein [Candidatus Oleimmundimicrobium sp.]|uniref:tetratricopeptide repeat protein n=1 Tax=Candidatus Oleimmundimicrobium sp. TaxID=3060597 RepID=UPI002716D73B|nr:tetratricopeptide repeat protein [Candidatus Oleimmundimicrobium sp.]MDO8885460.1 tetratricopeptide repeat protein [Candidatus Oleimmundimicrobium sp.]